MAGQNLPDIHLSIECIICIEIFKKPKILSCGHSFCTVCLEQMIRVGRGSFDCPMCREKHTLGKAGVDELKDNYALAAIVDSLKTTLGNQGAQSVEPAMASPVSPTRKEATAALKPKEKPKEEEKKIPTCVRHPGMRLQASCEQCEDTVCAQCIVTKCRPQKHKVMSIKQQADVVRLRLNLLLLGAAFSNLKDNLTIGEGLVEGGRVISQAVEVRNKIFGAHERALTFATQRKKQYLEIINEGNQTGNQDIVKAITLPILQRTHARLREVKEMSQGAQTATLGRDVMQSIISEVRKVVGDTRQAISEAEVSESNYEFIGYPPDGSVGELVYDKSSTIGVLSLSGGRLIVARDDRRIAGVCIGEVHQDRPSNIKWLFTLKPANYVAHISFCTLSLSSSTSEPEQNILIAVGQEIFIIDVNSSKYPTSENRCPAQGIETVCPKSIPKSATITGVDWYPVPLPNGGYEFSTEFVIYTSDKSHDLTVVSTSTGQNVRVISSTMFLSLIRCHIIKDDVAMLVRNVDRAKVFIIDTDGNIKHTLNAPERISGANPTLLCWVENPRLMVALVWVPIRERGWEIVLYDAENGNALKTIHGTGETPTGLDGLIPNKLVMCFDDGGVRICSACPGHSRGATTRW